MKFAAIDVGSNSVRYLAVELRGHEMVYLASGTKVTRLTEGIGEGPVRVKREALERTRAGILDHLGALDALGVPRKGCVFFGTESLRSASNADEVRKALESAAGLPLEVLSGEQEGHFSAAGAFCSGIDGDMVFDLGGGSLEIRGTEGIVSLPLGAVRIRGLLGEDPRKIDSYVREQLDRGIPGTPSHLIGVGGTSSSIAMMLEKVPQEAYHPSRLHGRVLTLTELEGLVERLAPLAVSARSRVVGLEPKRADIIVAGLLVIGTLLRHLGLNRYRHSECDLLWGRLEELVRTLGFPVRKFSFPPLEELARGAGQETFQTL